jgi:nucleoside-diphosphate-sugar epimerase
MRSLVTGSAGFIGSHLTAALLDQGDEVVGLDCFTDYYAREIKEANLAVNAGRRGFRFVESRIEQADLKALLSGVTHVFHLAAQAGVRKSWGTRFSEYLDNNIQASQVLLEACVDAPLQKFVYASSSSVYGNATKVPMREDDLPRPHSPYGVTKLAAEQLGNLYQANYGVPVTSVRYFTVYGPRQRPDMAFHRFMRAHVDGKPIDLFGDGDQTRDFTFVSDAVSATIAAGRSGVPGRVYNVGGGSRVTLNQALDVLERVVGGPLMITRGAVQRGDVRDTLADTTLAAADFGFAPAVSLQAGLAAQWAWFRDFVESAAAPSALRRGRGAR